MHPESLIETFGTLGIFAIVFAESGLLFGFFLPGDSLLFTAGLLASRGFSNIVLLMVGCSVAAIVGDQVGYLIGRRAGPALFRRPDSRFFHQKNVERARAYFAEHGSKTIILARFVPVVRTFAPFVAGVGKMNYARFFIYNVVGGIACVLICVGAGLAFGRHPFVKKHFELVIIAIVVISVLPMVIELLNARRAARRGKSALVEATTIGEGPAA